MAGRPWTPEDIALLRESWYLYPKKLTRKDLERRFSRSFNAVRVRAQKLGFKSCSRWTEYEIDYVRRYYLKKTMQQIADELGRTRCGVDSIVQREKIGKNVISNSKWSAKECRALEILVEQGKTNSEISRLIGRSVSAIASKKKSLGLVRKKEEQEEANE